MTNKRGQMALIMTFVAAAGLILFAMSLNVNRVALNKLQVTISANQGAGELVSRMASYGEQTVQTTLGGQREKCSWSGVFMAIIMVIIIIIVIIISIVSHQYELIVLTTTMLVVMIAALAIAIAAIFIQALVVQPAITKMWNKMQQNISTQEDQFLQSGLNTGIQFAVSDDKKIWDYFDFNMNGRAAGMVDFSNPPPPATPTVLPGFDKILGTADDIPPDKVVRFTYYYTQYLEQFKNYKAESASDFQRRTQELVGVLGVQDRSCILGTARGCLNSAMQCRTTPAQFVNKCCNYPDIRPTACHPTITDRQNYPYVPDECKPTYAYPGPATAPYYALAYDPLACNREVISLPGIIGKDDGNQNLRKLEGFDNNPRADERTFTGIAPDGVGYRGEDSDGLLIPLFWMLSDTRPYVYDLQATAITTDDGKNCHWCSRTTTSPATDCSALSKFVAGDYRYRYDKIVGAGIFDPPTDVGQLSLSYPCTGDNCCVNTFRNNVADSTRSDTRKIDKVGGFGVYATSGQCPASGSWRPGSTAFCGTGTAAVASGHSGGGFSSASIPYNVCDFFSGGCSLSNTGDCVCASSGASPLDLWRNDDFDDFYTWLQTASVEAQAMSSQGYSQHISEGVEEWAPGARDLLAELAGWRVKLLSWNSMINTWLNANYTGGLNDTWCLPADFSHMPADERAIVGAGTASYGNVDSVLNCLQFNSTNDQKFRRCRDFCQTVADPSIYLASNDARCRNLPRSLAVPATTDINDLLTPALPATPLTCTNALLVVSPSYTLAIDQSRKMTMRYNYLKPVKDRAFTIWSSLGNILTYLGDPSDANSVFANLEKQIQTLENPDWVTGAKVYNEMIYGWRGDPSQLSPQGLWHMVKVEAWTPKRCDGYTVPVSASTGESVGCCATKFPWVKTYKKGELKRCYGIRSDAGRVKVRTTRFDETATNSVNFLNNIPLWTYHYSNPFQAGGGTTIDLSACEFINENPKNYTKSCRAQGLETMGVPTAPEYNGGPWAVKCNEGDTPNKCESTPGVPCAGMSCSGPLCTGCVMDNASQTCTGWDCTLTCVPNADYTEQNLTLHRNWDRYVAPGAFFIFSDQDYAGRSTDDGAACRQNVREAIRRGVSTEVCAAYFMGSNNRYQIKFTRCDTSCDAENIHPNN